MILYIGSENIYLFDDNFSKIFYKSKKDVIDYGKLINLIGKNNIFVFINSFFSVSEHKTFQISAKKQHIRDFIKNRFSRQDVTCASYNNLFRKGEGSGHKNDIIMTIIKNNEQEEHIKKIINELLKTDLNLSKIYSFDQAINTIGLSYSPLNRSLNVTVIVLENSSLIVVSNTVNYMFGRLIKKRSNEAILETTIKMLIITLKYIGTTYSFLQNETKVSILSTKKIDIESIKTLDPVFDIVFMSSKILEMPKLKIETDVSEDISEIQLLKLAIKNIKYVSNLTNADILMHTEVHRFIKILRIIAFSLFVFSISYGMYKYIIGTELSNSDKEVEQRYVSAIQNVKNKEKQLINLNEKIYAIIATNFKKNSDNNIHVDCVKLISNILKKYRKLFFVESYRFEHDNVDLSKKNILYIDFALFNINSSIKFVINELSKIEADIKESLLKIGYNVDIDFQQISRDKHIANFRDVRDTMIITFQKK